MNQNPNLPPTLETYRDLAWSASQNMTPGGGATLHLQAVFKIPQYYTVKLGIDMAPNATGVGAIATIVWTTKGNSVIRKVQVADGVSISGTAEAVTVTIADASAAASAIQYVVTALVTPGSRPGAQLPTLSGEDGAGFLAVGAGATTAVTQIPNAGVVAITAQGVVAATNNPVAAGALFVEFVRDTAGLIQVAVMDITTLTPMTPIPANATHYRFRSAAVACVAYYSWGIDG